jgi:hypothetical protein
MFTDDVEELDRVSPVVRWPDKSSANHELTIASRWKLTRPQARQGIRHSVAGPASEFIGTVRANDCSALTEGRT